MLALFDAEGKITLSSRIAAVNGIWGLLLRSALNPMLRTSRHRCAKMLWQLNQSRMPEASRHLAKPVPESASADSRCHKISTHCL